MKVIEVDSISFAYDGKQVLQDVSFQVSEGEFVALFGPNGGGKTTLFHLLMGFLKPQRGEIRLFNQKPKEARKELAWVPQNFHFDPYFPLSVEEVVLGGRMAPGKWRFSAEDRAAAMEALEQVSMESTSKAPFAELSGGQKQRILIARALASSPKLLLLDEPTANVDHAIEKTIYELLSRLKNQMTILMVTHNLNRAVEAVDRLLCVQTSVSEMAQEKVCEHFALGLYHSTEEKT